MDQVSEIKAYKIGIIGLGYVGLPLAVAFSSKFEVIGFDTDSTRISELKQGIDCKKEVKENELTGNSRLVFTDRADTLAACNLFIVTVPTPLNKKKEPDLSFLLDASRTVGQFLKRKDIVIYESTVYPGCTEEDCVPVLERASGLKYNRDFFCGYSPERINPGDKIHTLKTVVKITSGSTPEIAKRIDSLYAEIVDAGTYLAPSIRVAEAAKAIENAQRDVNISFINEVALIFDRLGIDTGEVLEAAGTKWNFLPFRPGLVGGHCIGIDPHYLAFKSSQLGYQPQVILSGRDVNERMGFFVADKMIRMLSLKYGEDLYGLSVQIFGFAFKENCADTRNTKVIDIARRLEETGLNVSVYDPVVDANEVLREYGLQLSVEPIQNPHAVIITTGHDIFRSIDFREMKQNGALIFDAKGFLDKRIADARL